jgi:glucose-6-phosphate isomerase
MEKVSLCWENTKKFVNEEAIYHYNDIISSIHDSLHKKTGQGNEYLGWLDLPNNSDNTELTRIKEVASQIQNNYDALIVIGIGGSYLGSKAILDMLQHSFYNLLPKHKRNTPKIFFVGNNLSSTYLMELFEILEDQNIAVNVISKSGTTLEPAITFRAFRDFLYKKYGASEAAKRIIVTTDKSRGALKELADKCSYETFVVPDDIGGRYSVLTAVGLLPLAVAGINIEELLEGAAHAARHLNNNNLIDNQSYIYAVIRNILYKQGKRIELLAYYEPNIRYFAEWWKQLFGESEGKDGKGLFPVSIGLTTELHSIGQYIQDGHKHLFETVLFVNNPKHVYTIDTSEYDLDRLNQFAGQTMGSINNKACEGATKAHVLGNVPNLRITIPELIPYHIGYLIYFFEKSCAVSGYLLGVNPFDQPGVEMYKQEMYKLLSE